MRWVSRLDACTTRWAPQLYKRTIAIQNVDCEGSIVRDAQAAALRRAVTAYFATLPGMHGRCHARSDAP